MNGPQRDARGRFVAAQRDEAPSSRITSAALAAQTISLAASVFCQLMLLVGVIGGLIGAFVTRGIGGVIGFEIVAGISWALLGAMIWWLAGSIFSFVLGGIAFGIVWLVYPDGWPPSLRWVLVLPAAIVGYALATALNLVFSAVESALPLQNVTAVASEFFVSFTQTALAVTAAVWIAPIGKQTVGVVFATAFAVIGLIFLWLVAVATEPTETPKWANVVACLLGALGAIAVPVAMARVAE